MPAIDDPLIDRFLDALWLEKGLSDNTRNAYRSDLALFNGWLQERDIALASAGREMILDHLAWRLEQGYKARSTARLLSGLRGFYRYLLRDGLKNAKRVRHVEAITGEFLAIDTALARLQSGDLCLILIDQVEEALAHIAQRIAETA